MKTKIPIFLLFLLLASATAQAEKRVETFTGRAVNLSGSVEYIERHRVVYRSGTVAESETRYFDGQNRPIGELVSDYSAGVRLASYEFVDKRANYRDGAQVSEDDIVLFRDEAADNAGVEKSVLPRKDDQIVGQGFHQFIRANLDAIVSGEIFHVEMVLPSRLDQFAFRIRCLKVDGDLATIRLEIDNWLLRFFAPHLDAIYKIDTRQLVRYEGISNLADASGEYKKVIITYSYDQSDG
jgi:hypothetical protein